ncbi:MAG: hypothetical protein A3F11_06815 [Gammaproteobacteria bacterium RIFCSPHIGHO2_12_FULL_37_14]|nr:MAG: hypothetical protein A3F11_06815 [Gammaproteobacteria bacterium RIFCSPHIGHO2_12_FULL_37_14]
MKAEQVYKTLASKKVETQFNSKQVACLIFFSMLYMSVMIANAVLTKKWISIGPYFVFGGAFVSPFLFIFGDIIAELFGCDLMKKIILFGFICQTIFAIIVQSMIQTPVPAIWHEQYSFSFVFDSIVRINLSSFIAYFVASIMNVVIITRWKAMVHGKYFWLRSIGASTIAEACYSAIAILMIGFGSLSFSTMLSVIAISYAIKLLSSIVFAYPANILINYIKSNYKIDVYDSINYNPFLARAAV